MDSKTIYVLGAGSYGTVICELAELNNYHILGFYDDDIEKVGRYINNYKVLGEIDFNKIEVKDKSFVIAIGNNKIRRNLSEFVIKNGGFLPTIIHPRAEISKYAKLGTGCIIHANSYIWTQVQIEDFCIISPLVIIAHHTKVQKGCFISAGANVGAGLLIEEGAFIGIGATIMTGIKVIGANSIVGAGSTVIKDIEANSIVVGSPARSIKSSKKSDPEKL